MVTGGSPMGLGGGAYPILLLHIFIIIEFKLAGTKATTGICQLSFAFHLNHLGLRSYIFFLHCAYKPPKLGGWGSEQAVSAPL